MNIVMPPGVDDEQFCFGQVVWIIVELAHGGLSRSSPLACQLCLVM